jgi:hypothetical protein
MDMLFRSRVCFSAVWLAMLLVPGLWAWSQATPETANPASPPTKASAIVQPALTDVQTAVSGLSISRWKAPGDVKNVAQQNTTSIQHDLADTLPGLLTQADAAPGAVPSAFSVYRNLDALYDVLLRVYGTASLAAPQNEADALFASLQRLEAARAQLGDAILSSSQQHEEQLFKLQAALKAASAAAQTPPPPPKAAVVDDGPAASPSAKKKKKTPPKPAPGGTSTTPAPTG